MTQAAKIEETEAADFPKMTENAVKIMNTRAIVWLKSERDQRSLVPANLFGPPHPDQIFCWMDHSRKIIVCRFMTKFLKKIKIYDTKYQSLKARK